MQKLLSVQVYERFREELLAFNEDELFYKEYYHARQSPAKLARFLSRHTKEEVASRHLICPEIFRLPTDILSETYFSMDASRNIILEKHNRYAPAFVHCHDYFESFYVISGSCTHMIRGRTEVLPAGSFCMIAPGIDHSISVTDDNSIVLNILVQKSTFHDIFQSDLRSSNIIVSFFMSNLYTRSGISYLQFFFQDPDLLALLLQMYREMLVRDSHTSRILSHEYSIFFSKLVRRYEQTGTAGNPVDDRTERVTKMVLYISDHYRTATLRETARHFGYSEAYCSRLLKSITGSNFSDLLRKVRMEKAEVLLKNSSASVEEIGADLGYEDTSAFIRAFRKDHTVTPGKYRRLDG